MSTIEEQYQLAAREKRELDGPSRSERVEYIQTDPTWKCHCGNVPEAQGFHPWNRDAWKYEDEKESRHFRCDRCLRTIVAPHGYVIDGPLRANDVAGVRSDYEGCSIGRYVGVGKGNMSEVEYTPACCCPGCFYVFGNEGEPGDYPPCIVCGEYGCPGDCIDVEPLCGGGFMLIPHSRVNKTIMRDDPRDPRRPPEQERQLDAYVYKCGKRVVDRLVALHGYVRAKGYVQSVELRYTNYADAYVHGVRDGLTLYEQACDMGAAREADEAQAIVDGVCPDCETPLEQGVCLRCLEG